MPRFIFLIIILILSTSALAQQEIHTFYLYNGDISVGEIIEMTSDGDYVVHTLIGQEMVIMRWQIKAISSNKEKTDHLKKYGGRMAIGFSMFGNGIMGVNHHFGLGKNFYADAIVQYSVFLLQNSATDKTDMKSGIATFWGFSYFMGNRFSSKRNKVNNVGLFMQVGHTFSNYNSSKIAGGITAEYFNKDDSSNSYTLEIGIGLKIRHWIDSSIPSVYNNSDKPAEIPVLHLGFRWNIYYGKEVKPAEVDF